MLFSKEQTFTKIEKDKERKRGREGETRDK